MHNKQTALMKCDQDSGVMTLTVGSRLRRAYAAPTLLDYGRVADLTAAGSGGLTEVRPAGGCDNSPNKVRC